MVFLTTLCQVAVTDCTVHCMRSVLQALSPFKGLSGKVHTCPPVLPNHCSRPLLLQAWQPFPAALLAELSCVAKGHADVRAHAAGDQRRSVCDCLCVSATNAAVRYDWQQSNENSSCCLTVLTHALCCLQSNPEVQAPPGLAPLGFQPVSGPLSMHHQRAADTYSPQHSSPSAGRHTAAGCAHCPWLAVEIPELRHQALMKGGKQSKTCECQHVPVQLICRPSKDWNDFGSDFQQIGRRLL